MYIKQVIIQGFKSYREQTVLEPFDPRYNVIVGRNGSGKSNFFQAIEFVLSDELSYLRLEQRQALLHESAGPRVISAYVEIIFDNSDGRLPIAKNEVYLKRVIGLKKDQYFLDRKSVSRQEVTNLLESAGCSTSNPYYIVKQGKINQMATASDSERLNLLKVVAGTNVYDDKRKKSISLLKETEEKLKKVQQQLEMIDERLKTLDEEKEELKEYQRWDNERRCLEYAIHEHELKEHKKKLKNLEMSRVESEAELIRLCTNTKVVQDLVRTVTKRLKEAKKEVQTAEKERDTLSAEQQQLLEENTKLTYIIDDLVEEMKGSEDSRHRAQEELEKLKTEIAAREEELAKLRPEYEEMKRVEEKLTRELQLEEQKRKELYAKHGRGSQFASKDERDKWIQAELEQLAKQIKDKEQHARKMNEDLKRDSEKQVALKGKIEKHMQEVERQRASMDELNKHYYEFTKARDHWQSTRREQCRQESVLQLKLSGLKEDLAKADQNLRSVAGKAILNGRDSVRTVLDTFRQREDMAHEVAHYYGPLIENFSCEMSVYTAVEVTAGNQLFYHIVETDKLGTKVMKEINKQQLSGEVTFMPLNRLHVKNINYPETSDAVPMISKLQYDRKYAKAMSFIFGKTLICRNLETATNLARTSGLDCVTLEGDQVSSKGFLTGGYFDKSRSRLDMQKMRSDIMAQIESFQSQLSTLTEEIKNTDQKISSYVSQIQKTETKMNKAKNVYDEMKADMRLMKQELSAMEKSRTPKEQSLTKYTFSLEAMRATQKGFESELHERFAPELSVADQRQVQLLNDNIKRLTNDNKEAFAKRLRLESNKNKVENLLAINLARRKDELIEALEDKTVEDRQRQLESMKAQLVDVEKRLMKVNSDFEAQKERVTNTIKKQEEKSAEIEKWKLKEKEMLEKVDAGSKNLNEIVKELNILQQKIAECMQKITDLGALPNHDLYVNICKMTTKQLFKEMEKVNNHFRKYRHVNKKALDQFVSFSVQKETWAKKKEVLDEGLDKIKEIMFVLEHLKCEAIQFTLTQVSAYFSEVFKKLVPSGHGHLVMNTADADEENDSPMPESVDFDRFTGVGVRVSFTGHRAEMQEMNQLSGGQKSLVALTLIFSIQKLDPAPFYLFDEIDQALDLEHRKTVADVIHELSSDSQFIMTTFRSELLKHANKCYGVNFGNKVSHVVCVTREEAANFAEGDTLYG